MKFLTLKTLEIGQFPAKNKLTDLFKLSLNYTVLTTRKKDSSMYFFKYIFRLKKIVLKLSINRIDQVFQAINLVNLTSS